jgi:hypothetical protein
LPDDKAAILWRVEVSVKRVAIAHTARLKRWNDVQIRPAVQTFDARRFFGGDHSFIVAEWSILCILKSCGGLQLK